MARKKALLRGKKLSGKLLPPFFFSSPSFRGGSCLLWFGPYYDKGRCHGMAVFIVTVCMQNTFSCHVEII